ncbi:hypothetical protein BFJ68_g17889 [Fusarium oxysporum]|uniref:Uncharacterized protein n=1 Tax=Fusarium oxysporum TaxID=5507 RepID=A0A420NE39_FUSOX|nr:hypothetical protein BFJ68_g17889 [Fusarium oxysporum]
MLASSIFQLFTDIIIAVLPQTKIWGLQMSCQRRTIVAIFFGVSVIACIAAGFVSYYTFTFIKGEDTMWNIGPLLFWSDLEMTCGFFILSATRIPKMVAKSRFFVTVKNFLSMTIRSRDPPNENFGPQFVFDPHDKPDQSSDDSSQLHKHGISMDNLTSGSQEQLQPGEQNPSNFAWRDPLWLDVQGVNDEGKTLRGEFPKDSRIVFVPVKTALPFKHWSLVVIYQENGRCVKAEHHDSLANLSRTQSIEKALKEVLGDTKLLLIDDFKQRDGYNCGVFVISAIERIVMGKQIPQDLDLAKERQKWRDRLPPSPFLNRETSLSHELSTLEPPNHQSLVSGTHSLEPASSSDNPPLAKDEILEQIQRVKENIQGKQNALSKMQNRETFRTEFGSIMASARRSAEVGDFWDGKEEQKRFLDAIEVVCKLQERFEPQVFRGESKTQVDQDIKDLKVQMKDLHQERVAMVLKEAQEAEAKARDLKLALQEAKKAQKEDTTEREEAQHDADHTAAQLEKARRDHSSNAG